MKRKMVYAGLSYLVGLFFASHFSFYRQILVILTALLVSAACFCIKKIKIKYYFVCVFFLISGFSVYHVYRSQIYSKIISYSQSSVQYRGKITQITNYADEKSSYTLKGMIDEKVNARILLYTSSLDCDYGDTLSFECTPELFENTYLFKQKDHYESSGIFIRTDDAKNINVTADRHFSLKRNMLHYREYINRTIEYILPGEYGAVISAMLDGDKSGIDDTSLTAMYRCGIGHVMAVSGMHLVLLASIVSAFLSRLRIGRKFRFAIIELMMLLFILFTGMSVSVIRSAIMLTLVYGAALFGRRADPLNSLCIAVIVLTAGQPFLVNNPAFILSVSGTYGAAVFGPYATEHMDSTGIIAGFNKKIVYMLCVSVCVFPFSVLYFDETSLISPFSNIFIMPLCVFILLCGFITALSGGIWFISYPVLIAGGLASKLLIKISSFIASFKAVSVPFGPEYIPVMTIVLTLFILLSVFKYHNGKVAAASVVISLFIMCISGVIYRFENKDVLSVFRLGTEKNSVLIITRGYNADIVDLTGDRKNSEYVKKTLYRYGIRRVNSVTFLKNPYQSMASFDDMFKLNTASHVYVPAGTYIYDSTEICGCDPEYADMDSISFSYDDYSVSLGEDQTVNISYGKTFVVCGDKQVSVHHQDNNKTYNFSNMLVRIDSSGNRNVSNLDQER